MTKLPRIPGDDHSDDVIVHHYYQYVPPGVKRVIELGTSAWIGEVDDTTVFKYPLMAGEDVDRLEAERKILEAIPPHKNVIGFKGKTQLQHGLLLN